MLSGSFPKNLTGLELGRNDLPRWDWRRWSSQIVNGPVSFRRIPTFGDYTIQHPVFAEAPEKPNVSASIRYTTSENSLVMRGQGLRTKGSPKHKQYPAAAQLLIDMKEYCGRECCYGCDYIGNVAKEGADKPGNAETWLRAGINHHQTFVVRQIAALWKEMKL